MSLLCDLAVKYGSDKAPLFHHNYTPFYHFLFKDRRDEVKKVLEIGLGFPETMPMILNYKVGASQYMFREYFPNAEIYAFDIRGDILFQDERIHTYECDQSQSGEMHNLIDKIGADFDLIIDDGSHLCNHQIISAAVLSPFLKSGGLYIIEDVSQPAVIEEQLRLLGIECDVITFNPWTQDDRLIVIRKK